MVGLGVLQPLDGVVDHVLRPVVSVANPGGRSPGERGELDVGIARLGLFHEPPLVAAVVILVAGGVHVAGLGPVGGVHVRTDLDLEDLHAGTVVGLEKIVENLAPLRLGIVDEQARVASAAADGSDTVEDSARTGGVDDDGLGGCGGLGRGGKGCVETGER